MAGAWDTFIIAKVGNYFNYSGRGEWTELQKSEKQKRGDRDLQGSPNDTEGRGGEGRGGKERGNKGRRREKRWKEGRKVKKTDHKDVCNGTYKRKWETKKCQDIFYDFMITVSWSSLHFSVYASLFYPVFCLFVCCFCLYFLAVFSSFQSNWKLFFTLHTALFLRLVVRNQESVETFVWWLSADRFRIALFL